MVICAIENKHQIEAYSIKLSLIREAIPGPKIIKNIP